MRFRILGPMEVASAVSTGPATPRAAKLRVVLATLLIRPNEVVPVESLIDELWGDSPPRTATTTLQVYISQLRKLLQTVDPENGRDAILTRQPGYLLRLDPVQLDLTAFLELHQRGQEAMKHQDYAAAAESQRRALALWRGELLSDTPFGPLLSAASVRLAEVRMAALEQRVRADLQLARHHDLIGELQALTTQHPLREELHAHLMVALYRSGRQAEALQVYTRVRRTLVDELAIEPGPALQRLHQRILAGETALLRPAGAGPARPSAVPAPQADDGPEHRSSSPAAPSAAPPTANLPAADRAFVGRSAELALVARLLREAPAGAGVLVTGKSGVGKTSLAVEAAHRAGDVFPDGRIHLDLQPGRPLEPAEALSRLVRHWGIEGALPTATEELRDLVQRLLAGRRVLLVLDNAASAAQVRPLLPATPGSTALITSRRLPVGLTGVTSVVLDTLDPQESRQLFGIVAGTSRPGIDADGRSTAEISEIVELCGRLPLAVRIAATQLATRPHWTAASLASRLRDEHSRLSKLRIGDMDVRGSLTIAYRESPAAEQRAFRLLGLIPTGHFGLWNAAAALGVPADEAERLVDSLVDGHLLEAPGPDGRYRFHELLRMLAVERLDEEEDPEVVRAATGRMCEAYATVAGYADAQLAPDRAARPPEDWAAAVVRDRPADWFADEQPAVVEAVAKAHAAQLWEPVLRLVNGLTGFLEARAAWDDWDSTHRLALDAARRCGDRSAQARLLRSLGDLAWQRRQLTVAEDFYRQAQRTAEEAADRRELGRALVGLAEVRLGAGEVGGAAELLAPALAEATVLGDARGQYEALRAMALLALQTRRPEVAEQRFAECLELAGSLRDRRLEAYARRAVREVRRVPRGGIEVRPGVWRLGVA